MTVSERITKIREKLKFDKILMILIILLVLYRFSGRYTKVFELNKKQYILQVIEERPYDGNGLTTDIFSYMTEKKEIGCGKVILAGIDKDKEYFYGKSEYRKRSRGYGKYRNDDKNINIEGNEWGDGYIEEEQEYIRRQCTGYFVLNLKTGEYEGLLSEKEMEKILSEKGIKNKILPLDEFLYKNAKSIRNYDKDTGWMRLVGN